MNKQSIKWVISAGILSLMAFGSAAMATTPTAKHHHAVKHHVAKHHHAAAHKVVHKKHHVVAKKHHVASMKKESSLKK